MIPISIEEAAQILDVNPATVRRYVAEQHLPVIAGRGRKGAGNGAQVDLARLPAWQARRKGFPSTLTDPKRNPLRDAIELFEAGALGTAAAALVDRAEALGLTPVQVGMVWSLVVLAVTGYRTGHFEQRLAKQLKLGDLDDLCSTISMFAVRTEWKSDSTPIPPVMAPYWKAAEAALLAAKGKRAGNGAG